MTRTAVGCALVVGLGSIGRRHARIIRGLLPDTRIVALRHRPHEGSLPPNIDLIVSTLEDALREKPSVAVIATPATYHVEMANALVEAGVSVLVEKPIAASSIGVAELIALAERKHIPLMTGYNLRFSPSLMAFRDALDAGTIGRLCSVSAEVGQALESWRSDANYRTGVSANAALGGGALLELSHEIDYCRWLFGEIEWVSAILSKQSRLEIDVEDTVHMTVGFASPGMSSLVGSIDLDFVRQDATRTCTAIGETGTLRWNGIAGTVSLLAAGEHEWRMLKTSEPHRDETYVAEWRHFLDCVASGRDPLVTGRDGLEVMYIIDAARVSSAADGTKQRVFRECAGAIL